MKRIVFLSFLVSILLSLNSFAAEQQFQASIIIRSAISISQNKALTFGEVESSADAQNIQVNPGDAGAASFDVVGDEVEVSFSVDESSINMDNGGDSILVDGFNIDASDNTLDPNTAVVVNIGATAHVNANQPAGTYTGTATFRVTYN